MIALSIFYFASAEYYPRYYFFKWSHSSRVLPHHLLPPPHISFPKCWALPHKTEWSLLSQEFSTLPMTLPCTKEIFFFKHLYWNIIALQWCASFCFITKWISYTYTYVLRKSLGPLSLASIPFLSLLLKKALWKTSENAVIRRIILNLLKFKNISVNH